MALGTFTVTIDGNRLGAGVETSAKIQVKYAAGREFVKDDAEGVFWFPHVSSEKLVEVSLPHTLTLVTDVTSGESTEIGYEITIITNDRRRLVAGPFAAQAAGSAIDLTAVTSDFAGTVPEDIALRAETAAAQAEAAAASVPTDAELSATYASLDRVAPRSTVALIGTSITAQNSQPDGYDVTAGQAQWDALGYWTWAAIKLRHRLVMTAQKGVGSNTTTQMVARFGADILALDPLPGWVVIEPGPNDAGAGGLTAATSIANLTTMIDQAVVAGIRVALCTVTPSSFITSTAQKEARAGVNYWIKNTAPTLWPGLVVVDWALPTALGSTGGPNTAHFKNEGGQYVHPNNQGAAVMGGVLADALNPFVPVADVLPTDAADPYNLSANVFGTGGSSSTLPTSWSALSVTGSALTGTVSTIASTDGNPAQWGQAVVTSGGLRMYARATTGFVAGDTIEAACEFETDAAGWTGTDLTLRVTCVDTSDGSEERVALAVSIRSADGANPTRPASGVLRVPRFTVPAGVQRIEWQLLLKDAGTVRVRRPYIRKVV